jgi:hypothetical protein
MVLRGEGKLNEARQEIAAELGADPQNAQARALLDQITRQMDAQTGKPDASKPSRDAGIDLK